MSSILTTTVPCALDALTSLGLTPIAIQAVPALPSFGTVEHAIVLAYDAHKDEYVVSTHRADEGNELGASFYTTRQADAHARFVEKAKRATLDEIIHSRQKPIDEVVDAVQASEQLDVDGVAT